ncbi:hypothetical protein LNP00_02170 [Fructobacillus sp. M158]|uniref:hypothetical protein n=1 Tax=Fructobacillus parabroussonetiae TaxID=2713174 RepID=UPI00200AA957|nr:hypothetical protein [Fructobacillus parabroussonetiae]MCK8617175.1 hypothetical protein [Fructobacillus parabroussonetiae]
MNKNAQNQRIAELENAFNAAIDQMNSVYTAGDVSKIQTTGMNSLTTLGTADDGISLSEQKEAAQKN